MPVTKTAKRALRSSQKKAIQNKATIAKLEIAIRKAKKTKNKKDISLVYSLADKAAKKHVIHTKKADRIKSSFSS
ncbi:MAG: 30S ribosomal protein S20 [Patescibacteria group bacterium]|nr:30S ribosomal protein S20 [Patescibacteria group bacterium]